MSDDGAHCLVSSGGRDSAPAFNYVTGEEVGEIEMGYRPQRVQTGEARSKWRGQHLEGSSHEPWYR